MMTRRFRTLIALLLILIIGGAAQGQDGLNLPTELYVLLNSGEVERIGVGSIGVETITPEDMFVLDFAVAPDNDWIALRIEEGLSLASINTGIEESVVALDSIADVPPIRGRGDTIAWSPDGKTLVYTTPYGARAVRNPGGSGMAFSNIAITPLQNLIWSPGGTYLAAEAENNIWWIYHPQANEWTLAGALPSSYGVAWYDDSRLIFAPEEGGLYVLDFANANQQSRVLETARLYRYPVIHTDGSISVFSRLPNETGVPDNNAFLQKFNVENGQLFMETSTENPVDLTDLRWAPGGDFLIAFRSGVLALVLPSTGEGFPLPIASVVAYSWGAIPPPQSNAFILNHDGFFLARDFSGIQQMWRLPRSGQPSVALTTAEADVTAFTVAENGGQIAYVSGDTLWTQPINATSVTGDPVEVADVESGAHDLTFNVQGDTIAYARANDSSADESGVWLVATTGGEKRLALQNGDVDVDGATLTLDFSAPQFAPNINALLVRGQSGERIEYGVLDPAAGALVIVGQYDGMSWLADGRLLGYRSVVEGGALIAELNVIDPAIQPVEPTAILRAGDSMILTAKEVASGQVMVVFSDANFSGPARLRLAQVAVNQGEPDDIADIGFMDDPQISADGAFVAGILQASGRLLLFSPDDGLQMLTSPTNISDFLWATFR